MKINKNLVKIKVNLVKMMRIKNNCININMQNLTSSIDSKMPYFISIIYLKLYRFMNMNQLY